MGNSTAMSIIALVLIILAELFTIIAIATNYWGEIGDTYNGGTYKGKKHFSETGHRAGIINVHTRYRNNK